VPYPVRIWLNPSHHCRAMTLPSSRRIRDYRADLSLGLGSPAYTVTARRVLGAGVPLDVVPTAVEDRPSRLPITIFPWSLFTVESSQNEFLSEPSLRRKKPCVVSCTIAQAWAHPSRRPWRLLVLYFGRAGLREKKHLPPSTCQPTTEIRTWNTP
jgi:hypothetical protein